MVVLRVVVLIDGSTKSSSTKSGSTKSGSTKSGSTKSGSNLRSVELTIHRTTMQ